MNPLAKFILLVPVLTASFARAGEPRVKDFVLDDHTVHVVPVSAARVTTISFPSPIAAVDGALTTVDGKTPGIFQIAYTKGTAYLSVLALAKGGVTNLNVRWNNRTYVFELRESEEPCYSVVLQSPPERKTRLARPLSPPRLFGMLDTARAFPLLKQYHPEAVADVEHRDLHEQPLISDCGDYEVRLTDAFRFAKEDTLIFQLTVNNRSEQPLMHAPEKLEVRVGGRVFNVSLTDLTSIVAPHGTITGHVAISGAPGERNDLSLKNDFTFVLSRNEPAIEVVPSDFKSVAPDDLPQ